MRYLQRQGKQKMNCYRVREKEYNHLFRVRYYSFYQTLQKWEIYALITEAGETENELLQGKKNRIQPPF